MDTHPAYYKWLCDSLMTLSDQFQSGGVTKALPDNGKRDQPRSEFSNSLASMRNSISLALTLARA